MFRLSHVVAPLALLAMAGPARAVPEGFTLTPVVDVNGGSNAEVTSMAWAPDGSNRLFITGRHGQVWIVKDGAVLGETFVQLVPRSGGSGELYDSSSETGLLSIAFDPDFVRTGHVYLFVTLQPQSDVEQQILQFTAVGDRGMERQVVIRGLATEGANHNGGTTAFGPDGLLYWAIGDNGSMLGLGDDAATSAAKVGRVPAAPNAPAVAGPFNDGSGPNFDYIFARGFRNPYTMTFEPSSGKLWVNVVGTSWEQIFVVPEGAHAGYPSENRNLGTGGANTIEPVIAYATGEPPARNVGAGGAVRAGDIITFTTASDHLLRVGNNVAVSGIDDASMNGTFTVTEVTGARSFRVANPGGDATSGNGTVASEDYGRVVAGGTFYDGSQLPEAYRGDFFFGDFLGGDFVRVEVTGSGDAVARMERFHTGLGGYIDASTGPDGALYLVQHDGRISKITFDATAQSIVAAPLHLQIVEGGRGVVMVSLAQQPAGNVSLSVQRMSGDSGLTVSGGAALTFTAANWDVPQIVEISSASDGDTSADVAAFSITATGLDTQAFNVRATEPIATPPQPDAGVFDAAVRDAGVHDAPPATIADAAPPRDAAVRDAAPGSDGGMVAPQDDDGGCGCRTGSDASSSLLAALALAALLLVRRRRA